MSPTGLYQIQMSAVSVSTAITLLQIKAGTAKAVRILRAWVAQSGSTTSTMQRIRLVRKSAAATVTSFTPILLTGAQAANAAGGTSATGHTASGEGTDGDILLDDVFNILNGWVWIPTPEERIIVPVGGMIGLKFPAAPGAALTVTAGIIFDEIG